MAASLLVAQPASASADAGIDTVGEVETAVETVLDDTPVAAEVEQSLAPVAELETSVSSDVAVAFESDTGGSVEIPVDGDDPVVMETTDWGSSCGTGWVQNNHDYISLTANGTVCKASTWGWISKGWAKAEYQYRVSWNWYSYGNYSQVRLGGF